MVSDRANEVRRLWRTLLKNMDNVLILGETLEELEMRLKEFPGFCQDKNIKVKSSEFVVSEPQP